jgi:hypothetical protein
MKDLGLAPFLILSVYLAMLFVMVRPGSQGPQLVDNVDNGFIGLIGAGTGGGTWSSG